MEIDSKRRFLIYVASPISKGDLAENVRRANAAGLALVKAGLSVIVPHGSCFWGNAMRTVYNFDAAASRYDAGTVFIPEVLPAGTTHADWYGMDLEIVRRVDGVLRLPGESVGADLEVAEARKHGLPVFYSVEEAIARAKEKVNG